MISERDFAELLLPHVLDDTNTWYKLARVSKRFLEVSRRLLVKKEYKFKYMNNLWHYIWTTLPDGQEHGVYKLFRNNQLSVKQMFKNGMRLTEVNYEIWTLGHLVGA